MERFELAQHAEGTLNGEVTTIFTDGAIEATIKKLSIENISIQNDAAEPIQIAKLQAGGKATWSDGALVAKKLSLRGTPGKLELNGTVDPNEVIAAMSSQQMVTNDFVLTGSVNVGAIEKFLPGTLTLKEDLRILDGKIDIQASSQMTDAGQRRLFANIDFPRLVADSKVGNAARKITWQKPFRFSAAAAQTSKLNGSQSMRLEFLKCESEFLTMDGQVNVVGNGRVSVNGDLQKLKQRLAQFYNVGDLKLEGLLGGQLAWKKQGNPSNPQSIIFDGDFRLNRLLVALGDQQNALREDIVDIRLDSVVDLTQAEKTNLNSTTFVVQAGQDRASLSLLKPIDFANWSNVDARAEIIGDLTRWIRRARSIVSIPKMNVSGGLNLNADVGMKQNVVTAKTNSFNVTNFAYTSPTAKIREPQVSCSTSLTYDLDKSVLKANTFQVSAKTAVVTAKDLSVDLSPELPLVKCDAQFRSDIHRLVQWFSKNQNKPNHMYGELAGNLKFNTNQQLVNVGLQAEAKDFVCLSSSTPQNGGTPPTLWSEPKITLAGRTKLNPKNGLVEIEKLTAKAKGLNIDANGKLFNSFEEPRINLVGTTSTDMKKIINQVNKNFDLDLSFEGNDTSKFALRGPLLTPDLEVASNQNPNATGASFAQPNRGRNANATNKSNANPTLKDLKQLNGNAQLRWKSGSGYGLTLGKGRVAAKLLGFERIDIDPINVKLSTGRLSLDPEIILDDETMMVIQPGTILNKATITPEMCRDWLKYVNPMLAEATAARGKFSVKLNDAASIPVTDPLGGTMNCTISLHQAELGPGPLGQRLIGIANQVRTFIKKDSSLGESTWLQMPTQDVNCKLQNGKVFHEKLTFRIKEVELTTTGSIGADQSMNLIAEIPVKKEWLKDNKLLSTLVGESIRVPITGTLTNPKVSSDGLGGLRNLPQKLIKQQAGEKLKEKANKLLEDKLNKGLQGLFGPKK